MINGLASSMYLPATLFEIVTGFNAHYADDMKCGDMGDRELLSFGLKDVSAKVDPYRLVRYDFPLRYPLEGFLGSPPRGTKISHQECVNILFTEMKELSAMFSFTGEYKMLIRELIDHFRFGKGSNFYSLRLNAAFQNRIERMSHEGPAFKIKESIHDYFLYNKHELNISSLIHDLKVVLYTATLDKFNSKTDRINGLGISIHDISAQNITLLDLQKYAMGWDATLIFKAQDHFGLDIIDIKKDKYRNFRFFRIWFFLQRHRDYAFKPFFTDFHSVVRIGEY
ncbi:hypothetical protein A8A57_18325 [Lelliottia amnigena]|nr:hypothetical protein A8A57_18325 [Lelliottia amnigena]